MLFCKPDFASFGLDMNSKEDRHFTDKGIRPFGKSLPEMVVDNVTS